MSTTESAGGANEPASFAEIRETLRRVAATQQETALQMKETDRRLKKAEALFTSQWGKLMESLVDGDLVPLLKQRGIAVERTYQRLTGKRNGEHFEIDILAVNGSEVVVVEVKTTLRSEDVIRFLEKLKRFLEFCPEYGRHAVLVPWPISRATARWASTPSGKDCS